MQILFRLVASDAPHASVNSALLDPTGYTVWNAGGLLAGGSITALLAIRDRKLLDRIPIGKLITISFGFLLLIVGLAGLTAWNTQTTLQGFKDNRSGARQSVLAGRIQANFPEAGRAADDFVAHRDGAAAESYKQRSATASGIALEGKQLFERAGERTAVREIETQTRQHAKFFEEIQALNQGDPGLDGLRKSMSDLSDTVSQKTEQLKLAQIADQDRLATRAQAAQRQRALALAALQRVGTISRGDGGRNLPGNKL